MSNQWSVEINPAGCFNQLIRTIHGHLADLRSVLRAIDDGTFVDRARTPSANAVIQLQVMDAATSATDAARRATTACFKSMITDFISFLDRMIATRRVIGRRTVIVERPLKGQDEINLYLQEVMHRAYLTVARDRSLTNPAKLRELNVSSKLASIAKSFFALRRCVEHHGGVPDTEIRLEYKRLRLATGGNEIVSLPHELAAGDTLEVGVVDEQKVLPAGQMVTLCENDIDHIAHTIQLIAREIYDAPVV